MFVTRKRPDSSVRRQRKVATEMEEKYGLIADARLYDLMHSYGLDNPDRAAPSDTRAVDHKKFDKASMDQPGPKFSKKENKPTFAAKARHVVHQIGRPFVWYYNWTFDYGDMREQGKEMQRQALEDLKKVPLKGNRCEGQANIKPHAMPIRRQTL